MNDSTDWTEELENQFYHLVEAAKATGQPAMDVIGGVVILAYPKSLVDELIAAWGYVKLGVPAKEQLARAQANIDAAQRVSQHFVKMQFAKKLPETTDLRDIMEWFDYLFEGIEDRFGLHLTEEQVNTLIAWLQPFKANHTHPVEDADQHDTVVRAIQILSEAYLSLTEQRRLPVGMDNDVRQWMAAS